VEEGSKADKIKLTVKRKFLIGLALLVSFACNSGDENDFIKQEHGTVWLSGGLFYCAEQIHLDNGDILVVKMEDILSLTGGDRVSVRYRELGANEFCPSHVDCEIIEIKRID